MCAGPLAKQAPIPLPCANGIANISMRARRRRRFEAAAQIACFEAWNPGTGNMRNETKTSLSNGGLADSRGAAGRSPDSGLLNHCVVGGLPFGGSRASGKSNERRGQ
jgi:hypothetical protein